MLGPDGKPLNGGQGQPQQIRVDPNDLEDYGCPGQDGNTCESKHFMEVVRFKKVPAMIAGKAGMMPIQTFICIDCGKEVEPDA